MILTAQSSATIGLSATETTALVLPLTIPTQTLETAQ
jgi:hypothetical protein